MVGVKIRKYHKHRVFYKPIMEKIEYDNEVNIMYYNYTIYVKVNNDNYTYKTAKHFKDVCDDCEHDILRDLDNIICYNEYDEKICQCHYPYVSIDEIVNDFLSETNDKSYYYISSDTIIAELTSMFLDCMCDENNSDESNDENVEQYKERIKFLESEVEDMENDCHRLKCIVSDQGDEIDKLQKTILELNNRIDELETEISEMIAYAPGGPSAPKGFSVNFGARDEEINLALSAK